MLVTTRDTKKGEGPVRSLLTGTIKTPQHDKNYLLATLPVTEFECIRPNLELIKLPLGWSVYEAGVDQEFAYFPTTGIISLLNITENGQSSEIAVVGKEGFVGVALLMNCKTTPSRAMVQSSGNGYRIKASALKKEFDRGREFQKLLLRYTQSLITQMGQTAVCNRHHVLEQQLCRCLLMSLDRIESSELLMTQELIANMLGVRREGVTEAAINLQKAELITYRRGRITVLNRSGLEKRVCECYSVVKKETERLLPGN